MKELSQLANGFNQRPVSRRKFLQLAAAGTATAALVACAPAAAPAGSTSGEAASGEEAASSGPVQGGTLGLMGHQEVAGLSPDYAGPSVQETAILAIHDSVLMLDEMLTLQPILAESYEVSEDGLTYTFNLREGVLFHDGKEMTAADVKYTMDYYREPENATSIASWFLNVETIETPDDYTVVVNMADVNAAFLTDGGQIAIVQGEYHAEVGEDAYSQSPIGTGPFKLVEFDPASLVLMEAHEDYFRGRPNIDMIRQENVPEPSVRTVALETGDSDSALWPLLVEDSQRLEEDPNFTVIATSTGGVKHIMLNNQLPQLSDKRVRQALLMALDRQRIIDDLWSGAATVAHSNLAPKYPFYSLDQDPSLKRYEYDPEGAMALLEEAGWVVGEDGIREKDGQKLTFTCTTITGDQARRPIAEFAQQQFQEIGVDMQLEEAPLAAIQEGQRNGTTDSSLYNWTYGGVDPNPASTLRSDGGQNWNSFQNEEVDRLIDEGLSIADPDLRQPIYHEIQRIVVEEVPMLYLQWDTWYNVFSSRVKGLPEEANDAFAIYYNGLYKWWLDPAE